MASTNMKLKLTVDKQRQRVLFAVASKDFIDFLFNLILLPLLDKGNMVCCFANLYQSVKGMDKYYMQSDVDKDVLLKPKASTVATIFYTCKGCNSPFISEFNGITCPRCGSKMCTTAMHYVPEPAPGRGVVKGGFTTYLVMDDLVVTPENTVSPLDLFKKLNIDNLNALEEKVVYVSRGECPELLKHAMGSKTVLTNMFLGKAGSSECETNKRMKREDE